MSPLLAAALIAGAFALTSVLIAHTIPVWFAQIEDGTRRAPRWLEPLLIVSDR
jgi:hypothetical protein